MAQGPGITLRAVTTLYRILSIDQELHCILRASSELTLLAAPFGEWGYSHGRPVQTEPPRAYFHPSGGGEGLEILSVCFQACPHPGKRTHQMSECTAVPWSPGSSVYLHDSEQRKETSPIRGARSHPLHVSVVLHSGTPDGLERHLRLWAGPLTGAKRGTWVTSSAHRWRTARQT